MVSRRTAVGSLLGASALLGAALVGASSLESRATGTPGAPGRRNRPRLRRGVNVHNMLNWPDHASERPITYAWPPFTTPEHQLSEATVSAIRGLGFDYIRLTFDPAIYLASGPERRAELRTIALSQVQRFLDAGFDVILDLHPVAENPDYRPDRVSAAGSAAFSSYLQLVHEMAYALRQLPHERFAFELMNEPPLESPRPWQAELEALHAAARSASSTLPLILNGCAWDDLSALEQVDITPFAGSNVLYTFHYYAPHIFTHQGVTGADPAHFLHDLQWPARRSEVDGVEAQALAGVDADLSGSTAARARTKGEIVRALDSYVADAGERQILDDFASLAAWARRRGVAAEDIVMGEFGVRKPLVETPEHLRSRITWLTSVRRAAEAHGFAWSLWLLKGDGGMALLPDESDIAFDVDVLRALGMAA